MNNSNDNGIFKESAMNNINDDSIFKESAMVVIHRHQCRYFLHRMGRPKDSSSSSCSLMAACY